MVLGVSNLDIWTHKELVEKLEQKGNETLMEFINILIQKHEKDLRHNGMFVTPKHQRQNNAKPFYKRAGFNSTGRKGNSGNVNGRNDAGNGNLNGNVNGNVVGNIGQSRSIPSSVGCMKSKRREPRRPPASTLSSARKGVSKGKR